MDIIEFLNIWIFADFENFDFDFWSILAVGGSFRPQKWISRVQNMQIYVFNKFKYQDFGPKT